MTTASTLGSSSLPARARELRELILRMGSGPAGAHIGGSLSCTDIITVLFGAVLNHRPNDPHWLDRDRFVLSKGHAAPALYGALAQAGYFSRDQLAHYTQPGSGLAGHPLRSQAGVEFATGSLGHGLGLGAGIAWGLRSASSCAAVYVLLGDGELQEGTNWEAAMFASHYQLGNLVAIVDRNGLQISGRTEECLSLEPLHDRWEAFGWDVHHVDGHSLEQLRSALTRPTSATGKPRVVIANTIKGKGVAMFEGNKKSHSVELTPRLLQRALADLRKGDRNDE